MSLAGYSALPCQWRDPRGRCVLQQDAYELRLHDKSDHVRTLKVAAPGRRVILDLDSYTTQLPRNVSSRLRSEPGKSPSSLRIDWIPTSSGPGWLLARASDLTSQALQSGSEKKATYAVSATDDDDLIIGRQLALRLFAEMVYDSAEATWYVRAANVSESYSLTVRWVLAISLVLQALLIGRQLLNPNQVKFAHVLESLYSRRRRAEEPHILHWGYSMAVILTACVQLVLGQVYVGQGTDVDLVRISALRAVGITLSVAGACFALTHLVLMGIMKQRVLYTLSLEFVASATYILIGLCGLCAALLPRAAQGSTEIVLFATLLVLLIFFMTNCALVGAQVVPRRLLYKANQGDRVLFQQQTLLWIALSVVLIGLALALVFTGGDLVFAESVALFSAKVSPATAALLAQCLLLVIILVGVFVVLVETLDVDMRRMKALSSQEKSD
jgi:hypothetical protein